MESWIRGLVPDLGRETHRWSGQVLEPIDYSGFIGRNPGMTVGELLAILRITKQSLSRVLTVLIETGYVAQSRGRTDGRQRLLTLTELGHALERRLFERQRERLALAYREAGAPAVEGFRRVMRGIMDEEARTMLDRAASAPRPGTKP